MDNPIYATWCISNNLGDALTPWLITKITGQTPLYVPFDVKFPKYMVSGSVLNHATQFTTVWGAGIADSNDEIDPLADIRAVRGPLTARRARAQAGINVTVVGDPALLMPRFHNQPYEKLFKVGICPHYLHQREAFTWASHVSQPALGHIVKVLNVFGSPHDFTAALTACETIYSSSLHGLILADAYGIPSRWITGTAKLGGDGLKFRDHLCMRDVLKQEGGFQKLCNFIQAPGDDEQMNAILNAALSRQPVHIQDMPRDTDELYADLIADKPPDFSQVREALWAACPFKENQ